MPTKLMISLSVLLLLAGASTLRGATAATDKVKMGPAKAPLVIKVGVTEYQNIEATYQKYEDFFAQLSSYATPEEPVTFTFAIGTYGEVLDWYNNRTIDVAIFSAMPTADLLQAGESENLKKAYLGDLSVTVPRQLSQSSVLDLLGKSSPDPFVYRPVCIVLNADKELQTMKDVQRLWARHQLKFLFVRPYSLSGYIVPLDVLRLKQYQIDPLSQPDQIEFTYQHDKSLEFMIKSVSPQGTPTSHLVAFVLDDTRYDASKLPGYDGSTPVFRKIALPELDYSIPREIVVANYHEEEEKLEDGSNKFQKYHDVMKALLQTWHDPNRAKRPQRAHADVTARAAWRYSTDDWTTRYAQIQTALTRTSVPKQLLYKSNFDDLLDDLSRATSPRLALVLSGGGAKCAYQAGAIIEIERKLQAKNRELEAKHTGKKLDIGLVVGTSGGAINALLVALGITKEDAAQNELAKTWRSFRQEHFLRPSRLFSLIIGICFGLLQTLLIVATVLLFDPETMHRRLTLMVLTIATIAQIATGYYFQFSTAFVMRLFLFEIIVIVFLYLLLSVSDWLIRRTGIFARLQHWRQVTIVMMLLVGFAEALIATVTWFGSLAERVSYNHWVEHVWTLVTIICIWTFPYPFIIALVVAVMGSYVRIRDFDLDQRRERAVLWTAILFLFVCGVLMLQLLFKEPSPSESIGIERAFVEQIPKLVHNTVDKDFERKTAPDKTDLQALSEQLFADKLLQRDLVITTSRLPVSENDQPLPVNSLPDDLYFYYRVSKDDRWQPPPDKRFVPLKHNQDKLLDVVIGSSTIYPIFSPRLLTKVSLGNEAAKSIEIPEMRIIDGGFIHNIPIEAARSWGATHIIVIDASPAPQLRDPQHVWDNSMMAFGYLFKQAQATDTLARVGTFELRPTSRCEKLNVRPVCTDRDGPPEPNMDTFDFSNNAAERAFTDGMNDVKSLVPLFVRFPGAPDFRNVTPRLLPTSP
jgi:predicted acylesterase/phospholipase RssA/ABC-type phosphate/phosphonate transport system substrate-binding protein